ncbi:MAG TPA: hypothetical protein VG847_00630 [Chitinophagaceae bacterium]|nr:hypothetical protein [Chitinophagaceae bacterium]
MKIKTISIASFLILVLGGISCKKDNKPPDTLPPITQTGANTFGCKINGIVWVPYFQCSPFTGDCSEIQIAFHHPTKNFLPLAFQMLFRRSDKVNYEGYFSFTNLALAGADPPKAISATGNIYDSLLTNCNFNGVSYFYDGYPGSSQLTGNKFIITKLDTVNRIISGEFNFKLYVWPDSINVTDGRFDFKIDDYCKCS